MNPYQVPMGGCVACDNYVYVDGYMRPRAGFTETYDTFGDGTRPISHLSRFTDNLQQTYLMRVDYLAASPTDIIPLTNYVGSPGWVQYVTLFGEGDLNVPPTSAGWKGDWWFTTGGGGLYRYDPTVPSIDSVNSLQANTAKKVPDNPRIVIAGDSRLFIGDCQNANDGSGDRVPYRLAWSDFLDGTTWNGGVGGGSSGYVDLANDSDPITALYYSGSVLMVFKPNSFYLGNPAGPPKIWDFKLKTTGVGCICHQSLKKYRDGWIYWLGDENVYRGGTDRNPEPIGDAIRPRLREIVRMSNMTKTRALMDRQNHNYTLFFSSDADDGRVLKTFTLDLVSGNWWEGTLQLPGVDITDAIEFRVSEWAATLLVSTRYGKIYEMAFSALDDAGTAIPCSWKSGMLSVPDITQGATDQAYCQVLKAYAPTGKVRLGVHHGDAQDRMTYTAFAEQNCDGSSDTYVTELPSTAENFQVQVNCDDAMEGAHIAKLAIGVTLKGATRN